jgi:general stress protein 26
MADGKHLRELLGGFDTAMLVTRAADGGMHARPMMVAELEPDADSYFVTSIDAPKVAEIEDDSDVLMTFQSDKQYAAVYGHATVTQDRALVDRLWKEAWQVWFPQGRSDPSIALVRLDAERAEIWDNAGARGLRYAFEAAKAYLRGERPRVDPEQHTRVRMS